MSYNFILLQSQLHKFYRLRPHFTQLPTVCPFKCPNEPGWEEVVWLYRCTYVGQPPASHPTLPYWSSAFYTHIMLSCFLCGQAALIVCKCYIFKKCTLPVVCFSPVKTYARSCKSSNVTFCFFSVQQMTVVVIAVQALARHINCPAPPNANGEDVMYKFSRISSWKRGISITKIYPRIRLDYQVG